MILLFCNNAFFILFNRDHKRKYIIFYTHMKISFREHTSSGLIKKCSPPFLFKLLTLCSRSKNSLPSKILLIYYTHSSSSGASLTPPLPMHTRETVCGCLAMMYSATAFALTRLPVMSSLGWTALTIPCVPALAVCIIVFPATSSYKIEDGGLP